MIVHTCKNCSISFTKPNNPNRAYNYCSYQCRADYQKKPRLKANCLFCKSSYNIWKYELEQGRKYCSKVCADKGKDEGKTNEAIRLRTSKRYSQWRKAVFERDNYTCQLCYQVGGKLNADHIKRFADYPELRLDIDNGRTLCEPCHLATPTFGNRKLVGIEA